jgi:uncharacterized protein
LSASKNKTLVVGASTNPERYAYKAIKSLRSHGYEVEAYGNKAGEIDDVQFVTKFPEEKESIDTITLYLGPKNQVEYYDNITMLKPRRVIFNPGTENEELYEILKLHDIQPIEACTLVLLATGQY